MRYLVAVIAIAPFAALLLGMATNRAQVGVCCAPVDPVAEQEER
jgi:hypothetical protein